MKHAEVLARIHDTKIIAILRGDMYGRELDVALALVEGGVAALEVSIVSPDYARMIRLLAEKLGNRIAVGAGTVLTAEEPREVADCGASFVVSPNSDVEVIAATKKLGMASFPGAYTATEIVQAHRAGADAVKLFPAVSLGPEYVVALRGPLPGILLIPTGGITTHNIGSYIKAGAWAAGVGSELVHSRDAKKFDADLLTGRARAFAAGVREGAHA